MFVIEVHHTQMLCLTMPCRAVMSYVVVVADVGFLNHPHLTSNQELNELCNHDHVGKVTHSYCNLTQVFLPIINYVRQTPVPTPLFPAGAELG
jgi:hypothetical protein